MSAARIARLAGVFLSAAAIYWGLSHRIEAHARHGWYPFVVYLAWFAGTFIFVSLLLDEGRFRGRREAMAKREASESRHG